MADASIRIDGRQIADKIRFGQANGAPVANLVVAAGRSRKNEQTGQWETLSDTVYDVAFWREHHDLIAGLGISQGDTVVITGNVTGTDVYEGKAKVKVTGHGIQHFPKREGGFNGTQQPYSAPQQSPQQSYAPQQPAQQGFAQQGWPATAPAGQQGGGLTAPPF